MKSRNRQTNLLHFPPYNVQEGSVYFCNNEFYTSSNKGANITNIGRVFNTLSGVNANVINYRNFSFFNMKYSRELYEYNVSDSNGDISIGQLKTWRPQFLMNVCEVLAAVNDGIETHDPVRKLSVLDALFDFFLKISQKVHEGVNNTSGRMTESGSNLHGGSSTPINSIALAIGQGSHSVESKSPLDHPSTAVEYILADGSYYYGVINKGQFSDTEVSNSYQRTVASPPPSVIFQQRNIQQRRSPSEEILNVRHSHDTFNGWGYVIFFAEMKCIDIVIIKPVLDMINQFRKEENTCSTIMPNEIITPQNTVQVYMDGKRISEIPSKFGANDANKICRVMQIIRDFILRILNAFCLDSESSAHDNILTYQMARYAGAFEDDLFGVSDVQTTRWKPSGTLVLGGILEYEGYFQKGQFHGSGHLVLHKGFMNYVKDVFDNKKWGEEQLSTDSRVLVDDDILCSLYENLGMFSCVPLRDVNLRRNTCGKQGIGRTVFGLIARGLTSLISSDIKGRNDDKTSPASEEGDNTGGHAAPDTLAFNEALTSSSLTPDPYIKSSRQQSWKEYSGGFLNNAIHGIGLMVYTSGDVYLGPWKNGIRHSLLDIETLHTIVTCVEKGRSGLSRLSRQELAQDVNNKIQENLTFPTPMRFGLSLFGGGTPLNRLRASPKKVGGGNSQVPDFSNRFMKTLEGVGDLPQGILLNGCLHYKNGDDYHGLFCNDTCGGFIVLKDDNNEGKVGNQTRGIITNDVGVFIEANRKTLSATRAKEDCLSVPYLIKMATGIHMTVAKHLIYCGSFYHDCYEGQGILKYNVNTMATTFAVELMEILIKKEAESQALLSTPTSAGVGGVAGSSYFAEYYGEFRADKITGTGTMIYQNGDIYRGNWKDEAREGLGEFVFTYTSNILFSGEALSIPATRMQPIAVSKQQCPPQQQYQPHQSHHINKPKSSNTSHSKNKNNKIAPPPLVCATNHRPVTGGTGDALPLTEVTHTVLIHNIVMRGHFVRGIISDENTIVFLTTTTIAHTSEKELAKLVNSGRFQEYLYDSLQRKQDARGCAIFSLEKGDDMMTSKSAAVKPSPLFKGTMMDDVFYFIRSWEVKLVFVFKGQYSAGVRKYGTLWSFEEELNGSHHSDVDDSANQQRSHKRNGVSPDHKFFSEAASHELDLIEATLNRGRSLNSSVEQLRLDFFFGPDEPFSFSPECEAEGSSYAVSKKNNELNRKFRSNKGPCAMIPILKRMDVCSVYHGSWVGDTMTGYGEMWYSGNIIQRAIDVYDLTGENAENSYNKNTISSSYCVERRNFFSDPNNYLFYYYGQFNGSQRHGKGCLSVMVRMPMQRDICDTNEPLEEGSHTMEEYLNSGLMSHRLALFSDDNKKESKEADRDGAERGGGARASTGALATYLMLAEYAGDWVNDDFTGYGIKLIYYGNYVKHVLRCRHSTVGTNKGTRKVYFKINSFSKVLSIGYFGPKNEASPQAAVFRGVFNMSGEELLHSALSRNASINHIKGSELLNLIAGVSLTAFVGHGHGNKCVVSAHTNTNTDHILQNLIKNCIVPLPTTSSASQFAIKSIFMKDADAVEAHASNKQQHQTKQDIATKKNAINPSTKGSVAYPLLYGYHGEWSTELSELPDASCSTSGGALQTTHTTPGYGILHFKDGSVYCGTFISRKLSSDDSNCHFNLLRNGPGFFVSQNCVNMASEFKIVLNSHNKHLKPDSHKSDNNTFFNASEENTPIKIIGTWFEDSLHSKDFRIVSDVPQQDVKNENINNDNCNNSTSIEVYDASSSMDSLVVYNDGSFYRGGWRYGQRHGYGIYYCNINKSLFFIEQLSKVFISNQSKKQDSAQETALNSAKTISSRVSQNEVSDRADEYLTNKISNYIVYAGYWWRDQQCSSCVLSSQQLESAQKLQSYLFLIDDSAPIYRERTPSNCDPSAVDTTLSSSGSRAYDFLDELISNVFSTPLRLGGGAHDNTHKGNGEAKTQTERVLVGFRDLCTIAGSWTASNGLEKEGTSDNLNATEDIYATTNQDSELVGKLNGLATIFCSSTALNDKLRSTVKQQERTEAAPSLSFFVLEEEKICQVNYVWNHQMIDIPISNTCLAIISGDCSPSRRLLASAGNGKTSLHVNFDDAVSASEIIFEKVYNIDLVCSGCLSKTAVDIKYATRGKGVMQLSTESSGLPSTSVISSSTLPGFLLGTVQKTVDVTSPNVLMANVLNGNFFNVNSTVTPLGAKNIFNCLLRAELTVSLVNYRSRCYLCKKYYCPKCLLTLSSSSSLLSFLPIYSNKGIPLHKTVSNRSPMKTTPSERSSSVAVSSEENSIKEWESSGPLSLYSSFTVPFSSLPLLLTSSTNVFQTDMNELKAAAQAGASGGNGKGDTFLVCTECLRRVCLGFTYACEWFNLNTSGGKFTTKNEDESRNWICEGKKSVCIDETLSSIEGNASRTRRPRKKSIGDTVCLCYRGFFASEFNALQGTENLCNKINRNVVDGIGAAWVMIPTPTETSIVRCFYYGRFMKGKRDTLLSNCSDDTKHIGGAKSRYKKLPPSVVALQRKLMGASTQHPGLLILRTKSLSAEEEGKRNREPEINIRQSSISTNNTSIIGSVKADVYLGNFCNDNMHGYGIYRSENIFVRPSEMRKWSPCKNKVPLLLEGYWENGRIVELRYVGEYIKVFEVNNRKHSTVSFSHDLGVVQDDLALSNIHNSSFFELSVGDAFNTCSMHAATTHALTPNNNYAADHRYRRQGYGIFFSTEKNKLSGISHVEKYDGSWKSGLREGTGVASFVSVLDLYGQKQATNSIQESQSKVVTSLSLLKTDMDKRNMFYSRVLNAIIYMGQYKSDFPHGYGVLIQFIRCPAGSDALFLRGDLDSNFSQRTYGDTHYNSTDLCGLTSMPQLVATSLFAGMFEKRLKHGNGIFMHFGRTGKHLTIAEGVWYHDVLQGKVRIWNNNYLDKKEKVIINAIYENNQEQCNVFYIPSLFCFSDIINTVAFQSTGTKAGDSTLQDDPAHLGWQLNDSCQQCFLCNTNFGMSFSSLYTSKHHCRCCGWIVCYNCSPRQLVLPKYFFSHNSEYNSNKNKYNMTAESSQSPEIENSILSGKQKNDHHAEELGDDVSAWPVRVCQYCYYILSDRFDTVFFSHIFDKKTARDKKGERKSSSGTTKKPSENNILYRSPATLSLTNHLTAQQSISSVSVFERNAGSEGAGKGASLKKISKSNSVLESGPALFFNQRGNNATVRVIRYEDGGIYVGPCRNNYWWCDYYVFCSTAAGDEVLAATGTACYRHIYMPALYIIPKTADGNAGHVVVIDCLSLSTIISSMKNYVSIPNSDAQCFSTLEENRQCLSRLPCSSSADIRRFLCWYDRIFATVCSTNNSGFGSSISFIKVNPQVLPRHRRCNNNESSLFYAYDDTISILNCKRVYQALNEDVEDESGDAALANLVASITRYCDIKPPDISMPFKIKTFFETYCTDYNNNGDVIDEKKKIRNKLSFQSAHEESPASCSSSRSASLCSGPLTSCSAGDCPGAEQMIPLHPLLPVEFKKNMQSKITEIRNFSASEFLPTNCDAFQQIISYRTGSINPKQEQDPLPVLNADVPLNEPNIQIPEFNITSVMAPPIRAGEVFDSAIVSSLNNLALYGESEGLAALYCGADNTSLQNTPGFFVTDRGERRLSDANDSANNESVVETAMAIATVGAIATSTRQTVQGANAMPATRNVINPFIKNAEDWRPRVGKINPSFGFAAIAGESSELGSKNTNKSGSFASYDVFGELPGVDTVGPSTSSSRVTGRGYRQRVGKKNINGVSNNHKTISIVNGHVFKTRACSGLLSLIDQRPMAFSVDFGNWDSVLRSAIMRGTFPRPVSCFGFSPKEPMSGDEDDSENSSNQCIYIIQGVIGNLPRMVKLLADKEEHEKNERNLYVLLKKALDVVFFIQYEYVDIDDADEQGNENILGLEVREGGDLS